VTLSLHRRGGDWFIAREGDAYGPLAPRKVLRLARVAPERGLGDLAAAPLPPDAVEVPIAQAPPSVTRYELHGAPESIPVDWTELPAERRREVCRLAGFDEDDVGLPTGRLERDWNLHPAGSPVVATFVVQGHGFAVIDVP